MTVTGALSYLVECWRAHLEGQATQLRYNPTILDLTSVDEIQQEFKLIHMGTESLLQQCSRPSFLFYELFWQLAKQLNSICLTKNNEIKKFIYMCHQFCLLFMCSYLRKLFFLKGMKLFINYLIILPSFTKDSTTTIYQIQNIHRCVLFLSFTICFISLIDYGIHALIKS